MVADTASRPPGLVAEGIVGIAARFGGAARDAAGLSGAARKERLFNELYQTPIALPWIPITSNAGILIPTDLSGPVTGTHWSVRRLTAIGFSAGTVQVFKNGVQTGFGSPPAVTGRSPFTFPQSGLLTLGRGELLLRPDDWLMFLATGITLSAGYGGVELDGDADCFASWLLPDYIG